MTVLRFPDLAAESDRLQVLHHDRAALFDLSEDLGSPDEWLHSATSHLRLQCSGTGWDGGTIEVSRTAISLVLMKLEELLCEGPAPTIRPID